MAGIRVPRTAEEVAALEAAYRPFESAAAWSGVQCDADRWQRHADALREAVNRADPEAWRLLTERFLRAASLDSTVLAELVRPVPEVTVVVLRSALSDPTWSSVVEATQLVVECQRRAFVVARDAAEAGRPIDEGLIARLQDLIVESQKTYTVTVEDGSTHEVDLPKGQYKPISNYVRGIRNDLIPFAPSALVADEMHRLAEELGSEAFAQMHPVVQSAYIHEALSRIHPFADGNGRLARTVASIPLLGDVGLPPLILADQWLAYGHALARADDGDWMGMVELFLAAHVNTLDLARGLLENATDDQMPTVAPVLATSPERMLLDVGRVHLRAAVGAAPPDWRGALTLERTIARLVDPRGRIQADLALEVEPDPADDRWLRLSGSVGDALEVWREDLDPAPVEIVHLRAQSWVERMLRTAPSASPRADEPGAGQAATPTPQTPVRGLFVLGVPRSGTTLFGNYFGSHPSVLGLAEYGGFHVAHLMAPTHLKRLPGREHEGLLAELRDAALRHAVEATRERGRFWFCDATPWNLEIAGSLAVQMPDAVFVLMIRHFSGNILSLRQFEWAGDSWEAAARVWVSLNSRIDQLPEDRTLFVGYDAFASQPAETVAGIRDAMESIGLDPELFDDRQFTLSHAAIVGQPRPTVGTMADGTVEFRPVPSLDLERWTPGVHARVWPVVREMNRSLRDRFEGVYIAPPRPDHVPEDEW